MDENYLTGNRIATPSDYFISPVKGRGRIVPMAPEFWMGRLRELGVGLASIPSVHVSCLDLGYIVSDIEYNKVIGPADMAIEALRDMDIQGKRVREIAIVIGNSFPAAGVLERVSERELQGDPSANRLLCLITSAMGGWTGNGILEAYSDTDEGTNQVMGFLQRNVPQKRD